MLNTQEFLKVVSADSSFRVLMFLVDNPKSDVTQIAHGVGGQFSNCQSVMLNLHRHGLVWRTKPPPHGGPGQRGYLYEAPSALKEWIERTKEVSREVQRQHQEAVTS